MLKIAPLCKIWLFFVLDKMLQINIVFGSSFLNFFFFYVTVREKCWCDLCGSCCEDFEEKKCRAPNRKETMKGECRQCLSVISSCEKTFFCCEQLRIFLFLSNPEFKFLIGVEGIRILIGIFLVQ